MEENFDKNGSIETNTENAIAERPIGALSPGELHNDLVLNYLKNQNVEPANFEEMFQTYYELSVDKYPELLSDVKAKEFLISFTADFNIEEINQNLENLLDDQLANGEINQYLHSKFVSILNSNDIASVSVIINEIDSNLKNLSKDELERYSYFKSIFYSSNDLWSNYGVARGGGNGAGAIIGDAIGGAAFFYLGPFAPLAAGAVSLGAYYS